MVSSKSSVKGAAALKQFQQFLKNGCRRLKANALLDDASTQTYVNEDVAAELGLNGTFETIKINVLSGDRKSFQKCKWHARQPSRDFVTSLPVVRPRFLQMARILHLASAFLKRTAVVKSNIKKSGM